MLRHRVVLPDYGPRATGFAQQLRALQDRAWSSTDDCGAIRDARREAIAGWTGTAPQTGTPRLRPLSASWRRRDPRRC